jgi:hypothetical protein
VPVKIKFVFAQSYIVKYNINDVYAIQIQLFSKNKVEA